VAFVGCGVCGFCGALLTPSANKQAASSKPLLVVSCTSSLHAATCTSCWMYAWLCACVCVWWAGAAAAVRRRCRRVPQCLVPRAVLVLPLPVCVQQAIHAPRRAPTPRPAVARSLVATIFWLFPGRSSRTHQHMRCYQKVAGG
jgi:hypothetical protein